MTITFRQKKTLLKEGIKRAEFLINADRRLIDILSEDDCNICEKAKGYKTDTRFAACGQVCEHTVIRHLCAQLHEINSPLREQLFIHLSHLQEGKRTLEQSLENLETRYYNRKTKKGIVLGLTPEMIEEIKQKIKQENK